MGILIVRRVYIMGLIYSILFFFFGFGFSFSDHIGRRAEYIATTRRRSSFVARYLVLDGWMVL